jgi:hypothetical protein
MKDDAKALFPGREVKLTDAVTVTVMPVAFRDLRKFSDAIGKLLSAVVRDAAGGQFRVAAGPRLTVGGGRSRTGEGRRRAFAGRRRGHRRRI